MTFATLRQAMKILQKGNTSEGTRIREAIAVLQTGDQHGVLRLCTRSAGWDVPRREGGKDRPLAKVRAELRQCLISATRRHVEARGSDDSHLAAASRADAELATQPPRKKLKELAADMDVPEMRGDVAGILYKRVRGRASRAGFSFSRSGAGVEWGTCFYRGKKRRYRCTPYLAQHCCILKPDRRLQDNWQRADRVPPSHRVGGPSC